jgi:hypothetical protein
VESRWVDRETGNVRSQDVEPYVDDRETDFWQIDDQWTPAQTPENPAELSRTSRGLFVEGSDKAGCGGIFPGQSMSRWTCKRARRIELRASAAVKAALAAGECMTFITNPAQTEGTMTSVTSLPGDHLDTAKMPGHWLLLRLGKRVLRPGGVELARRMLDGLNLQPDDGAHLRAITIVGRKA